ncbi:MULTISPECIES: (Na+)-NQR maturation NqrM [Gammaproteobacteria]|uniref:(Na+)-NQR maturation NqrM n=1 Tax=Gammaproteobacteria TaxID=1236 RepID=UPI000DCF653A|nr:MULTISPECIES: (Na+)-NQR maturation NqrM [Gammaproteobacteria]RTE86032.1 (Na+)-NQR maturation NqrM [Aliidiomarina sp. B3213]TCZ91386.1 (Na+)-NQR maturation NqrM [Lysobacter sp. N42]
MQTLILAFVLMLIVFGGMAIGVLVQRKSLAGSCGGIGALGMDKACDCDKPCDKKQAKLAEEARKEKEKAWQNNRIH